MTGPGRQKLLSALRNLANSLSGLAQGSAVQSCSPDSCPRCWFALAVQEVAAGLELITALTHDDVRLLESLCLVGVVPAAARYVLPPWPPALRLRAAGFVLQLCFSADSTLNMLVACQVGLGAIQAS